MESRAKDVPAHTGVSEVFRSVDYSRVHLAGGATHLAPQRAAVTLIDLDRSVHLNRIQFSHCRGFGATSQLSFDDAPTASTVRVALPASVRTRLPAKLPLRLRLTTEIDFAVSHAGQPVAAVLMEPVQYRGQQFAPTGTVATGRLRWLHQREPGGVWMVGLEFSRLGESHRFFATLESLVDPSGQARLFNSSVTRERVGKVQRGRSDNLYLDMLSSFETIHETVRGAEFRLPGVGLLTLAASATRLTAGTELLWITE